MGSKYASDIVYSNVIQHAYRPPIAETKIFRLGVSLICPLYVKKEERIGKKLYYRKTKYITSNTEHFKVYLQLIITFLIIQYKSTLNLHLLYRIYSPIFKLSYLIHKYVHKYVYKNTKICQTNFLLFVFCNIVATHTYAGYTGFTFT